MIRDFTEATKERLLNEIDDINKSTWGFLTDAIGDAWLYANKCIGLLSLKDDMSNVESYQRNILDMTNMTKKKLEEIFDNVYGLDKQYGEEISDFSEHENVYNSKLEALAYMIQPNFSACDAETIRAVSKEYNDKLKNIDGKINKSLDKEQDWAAKRVALKSVKGLLGGGVKIVVDVFTLPVKMVKNIFTNNIGGIFSDACSIIDDVFSVGSNMVGLTSLGIGYTISSLTGNKKQKDHAIRYAEAYADSKGLTDAIEADEKLHGGNVVTSRFKKASQIKDTASAAIDLYDMSKGFLKEPSDMIDVKLGFKTKLSPLKKEDLLVKYRDDYENIEKIYESLSKYYHYLSLKNASKAYQYLESFWELPKGAGEVAENLRETMAKELLKFFKAFGDAYELGEDIVKLF